MYTINSSRNREYTAEFSVTKKSYRGEQEREKKQHKPEFNKGSTKAHIHTVKEKSMQ
jgi:hypothetical protein